MLYKSHGMGKRISTRKITFYSPCCESPTATRLFPSRLFFSRKALERFAPVTEQHQSCFTIQSSIFQKWQTVLRAEGNNNGGGGRHFLKRLPLANIHVVFAGTARRAVFSSPPGAVLTAAVAACLYAATTGAGAVCRCVHRARFGVADCKSRLRWSFTKRYGCSVVRIWLPEADGILLRALPRPDGRHRACSIPSEAPGAGCAWRNPLL